MGICAIWGSRWRWCQTNRLKHQKPEERAFYEAIRERHYVRAASRFILKLVRVESDLCELNRLWNEAWIEINQQNEYSLSNHLKIRKTIIPLSFSMSTVITCIVRHDGGSVGHEPSGWNYLRFANLLVVIIGNYRNDTGNYRGIIGNRRNIIGNHRESSGNYCFSVFLHSLIIVY